MSLKINHDTIPVNCLFVQGSRELLRSCSRVYVGTFTRNNFHVEICQYNLFQNNPTMFVKHQRGFLTYQKLVLCQQLAQNLKLKSFLYLRETRHQLNTDVITPTLAPCNKCFQTKEKDISFGEFGYTYTIPPIMDCSKSLMTLSVSTWFVGDWI